MIDIFKAVILGIVEGITEFLPISSTGHLILVNEFVGFTGNFAHMFDVAIQLGAILSVVVYFRHKLFPFSKSSVTEKRKVFAIWKKTIVGVLPALLIGAALGDHIEEKLFNPVTVSIALLIGGFVLIFIENRRKRIRIRDIHLLDYKTAFIIGFIQCLAMIPGTSRSAATIIGAMLLGVSRVVAAEYSFFLAIPTMFAATSYSLLKIGFALTSSQLQVLIVGFVVSFIVALLVIAGFMNFISSKDFKPFGYYRIILGLLVLIYFYF
ncbi:undecaprenyl-diphosphatase [Desulfocucumis palustris]|uniref:Undecaprenyl-diphosphatase n=1 Tax=Desulfocucumis palustris TaxID=1898651 RepID=A0A2L2XEW2_9FIRM|nr:undecaprenyl-diphosphate phosphatase [Desulfocucumis palustris]GBF32776.1 undecaprenyl-diphosphatase [Desulfocucumis palustris]